MITLEVLNPFLQTPIPQDSMKMVMKICDVLVDILIELCPWVYGKHLVKEKNANFFPVILQGLEET